MTVPARFHVPDGPAGRVVSLDWYLDPPALEEAETEANAWIKALRHASVEGQTFRDRFTYRGDSMWWFAELYLHKQRTIASAIRTVRALEALIAREQLSNLRLQQGDAIVRALGPQVAARHRVAWHEAAATGPRAGSVVPAIARRSRLHLAAALADRLRPGRRPGEHGPTPAVAAFVHSAFWRADAGEEAYIGPVLDAVAKAVGPSGVALVGLGPRTNFRSRSWRQRWREFRDPRARAMPWTPVERYAPWRTLAGSTRLWRERHHLERALTASADVRAAAVVRGYDLWPLVAEDLAGIALLQFPWSARAMDEAGAALDALRPAVAVTYAEAGGWGRALALEARRRGIPVVGLQHGFIYRHWLNYLHAPDEMAPSAGNPRDRGFPRPDLTLVHDRFAAEHLRDAGAFPEEGLAVTGNPKLDSFRRTVDRMTDADRRQVRAAVGAGNGDRVVVVATKFSQMAPVFADLVRGASGMPGVRLVVKCHPAETPEPYVRAAEGLGPVTVAPATTDLGQLIACAELLVTVNSTAAIEAMVLGVPALVLALPTNLSPFVEAGAMAGVLFGAAIGPPLSAILYDEEYRARLAAARRAFVDRYGLAPGGDAAAQAARAILRLTGR